MRTVVLAIVCSTLAVPLGAGEPPRLTRAGVSPAPWGVQSGGLVACGVTLDASGAVGSVDVVQDVAPYGARLRDDIVSSWRFEPGREDGRPVGTQVLVLAFFRPPALAIQTPSSPLYKTTRGPEDLPWPTDVTAPPYPSNATGSAKVVMEVDVSDQGQVASARVLAAGSAFDGVAVDTIKAWTFRPAVRANRPVASRAFVVFSFVGTTP